MLFELTLHFHQIQGKNVMIEVISIQLLKLPGLTSVKRIIFITMSIFNDIQVSIELFFQNVNLAEKINS